MNNGRPAAVQVVHATSHIQRNADAPLIVQLERPLLPRSARQQQVPTSSANNKSLWCAQRHTALLHQRIAEELPVSNMHACI